MHMLLQFPRAYMSIPHQLMNSN